MASACWSGWSRNITKARSSSRDRERRHDRGPVLPSAEHVAGKRAAAAAREIARARLARGGAVDVAGADRGARYALVDLQRQFVSAACQLARRRCPGSADHPVDRGGQSESGQRPLPDRQCGAAGGLRQLRAGGAGL